MLRVGEAVDDPAPPLPGMVKKKVSGVSQISIISTGIVMRKMKP